MSKTNQIQFIKNQFKKHYLHKVRFVLGTSIFNKINEILQKDDSQITDLELNFLYDMEYYLSR
jgi:thymidylate kinase